MTFLLYLMAFGWMLALFASMIGMLDPEPEETPDDMRRMDLINAELEAFRGELELWVAKTKGRA